MQYYSQYLVLQCWLFNFECYQRRRRISLTSKSDLASILSASSCTQLIRELAEKPSFIFCFVLFLKARPLIINEATRKHHVYSRLISFLCRLLYSLECRQRMRRVKKEVRVVWSFQDQINMNSTGNFSSINSDREIRKKFENNAINGMITIISQKHNINLLSWFELWEMIKILENSSAEPHGGREIVNTRWSDANIYNLNLLHLDYYPKEDNAMKNELLLFSKKVR